MAESCLKVNSLRLCFPSDSQEPTEMEIFDFMRVKMKLKADNLLSMYKDRMDASVVIKFKNEEEFKATLARFPDAMEFTYNKYQSVQVRLSPACAVVKYVRLFNFPPEVEDREIGAVLAKYGKVQRMVREKYAEDTGFPIWTSVRGAYVELKDGTEIPATLYVRNLRTRVFYEGLINKCFQCGGMDHIKVNCPKPNATQDPTYSNVLAGGAWSKPKMADETEEPIVIPDKPIEIEGEKRQSSPSIPLNKKDAKIAKRKETDDTSSNTKGESTISEKQQIEGEQGKDGDKWFKVPAKRGRKPKDKSSSLENLDLSDTFEKSGRIRRSMTISEEQSLRNRSRADRRLEQEKLNGSVSQPDNLEGTFLAETFGSNSV